jgi:hypothetical protein
VSGLPYGQGNNEEFGPSKLIAGNYTVKQENLIIGRCDRTNDVVSQFYAALFSLNITLWHRSDSYVLKSLGHSTQAISKPLADFGDGVVVNFLNKPY